MFVRPDYKLNANAHRPRGRGRLRILVALGLTAAVFGLVRFVDLPAAVIDPVAIPETAAHPEAEPLLTAPLALPGNTAARSGEDALPSQATIAPPQQQTPSPLEQAPPEQPTVTASFTPPAAQTATNESAAAPSLLAGLMSPASEPVPVQERLEGVSAPGHPADTVSDQTEQPTLGVTDEKAPSLLEEVQEQPQAEMESITSHDDLAPTTNHTEATPQWMEHEIASGDSLARIFNSQGLDARLLHRIVNSSKEAGSLSRIRPGQMLRFRYDDNKELTGLELQRNRVDSLRIAIADDDISAEQISKDVETELGSAAGMIESSLFLDGQKAGLSDGLIMQLATIFGWDIDFALEIRAGDQFRVLYEEQYVDGEKLRDGPILAAEFSNRGKTFTAVRYEDSNGEVGYFDADGHSKRRAFIRSPIKFARISSRYNPKRWHPVLKKWRSHKGVDYAAPKGTAIRATGDGRVIHRGTKGGYGRAVIVEHAGKYTTLYAHLSSYSKRAKRGNRVKQGQVIGYVGSSGLATGPHLHYEFRVRGKHRDPLRVKLPKSLSLPKSEIAKFRKTTTPLLTQLAAIQADTMVASAGVTGTR